MSDHHQSEVHAETEADARRAYDQAAFRLGLPFIILPALLGPVLMVLTNRHWFPHSLLLTVLVSIGWIVLTCVSVAYGLSRIRNYKRDHPFDGQGITPAADR